MGCVVHLLTLSIGCLCYLRIWRVRSAAGVGVWKNWAVDSDSEALMSLDFGLFFWRCILNCLYVKHLKIMLFLFVTLWETIDAEEKQDSLGYLGRFQVWCSLEGEDHQWSMHLYLHMGYNWGKQCVIGGAGVKPHHLPATWWYRWHTLE